MTAFNDALREADKDIFAALGGKGVLQDAAGRRYIVQCIVEQDIEILDDFGKVIGKRDYLDLILPDRVSPERGWQISVEGRSWHLDMPQATDGSVQTWSLRQ